MAKQLSPNGHHWNPQASKMHRSVVLLQAAITLLLLMARQGVARVEFLNTGLDVVPNEPFTLRWSGGGSEGVDIALISGDSTNLEEVQTLVSK